MEMEKPSSPRVDRTMSIKSAAAVSTVQALTARFKSLQDRLEQAAEVMGSEGVTLPVSLLLFFFPQLVDRKNPRASFFYVGSVSAL